MSVFEAVRRQVPIYQVVVARQKVNLSANNQLLRVITQSRAFLLETFSTVLSVRIGVPHKILRGSHNGLFVLLELSNRTG